MLSSENEAFKIKNNKRFLCLNFNLKKLIFSFFTVTEKMTKLLFLDKSSNSILENDKIIAHIRDQREELLEITNDLHKYTIEIFTEKFSQLDITDDLVKEIIIYFFSNKYKKYDEVTFLSEDVKESISLIHLLKEIFQINKSIKILNLEGFGLGYNIPSLNIFKEIISNNNSIKILDLGINNFGNNIESMKILKEILVSNKSIENLDLYYNYLNEDLESMKILQEALLQNDTIKILSLSSNDLGTNIEIMKILYDIIVKNKSLKEINLCKNWIGRKIDAMKLFTDMIIKNESIEIISFRMNDVGFYDKQTIQLLKEMLEKNTRIKKIDLIFNAFDTETLNYIKKLRNDLILIFE